MLLALRDDCWPRPSRDIRLASSLDRSVAAIDAPEWVFCARQNLKSVFVFQQISARGRVHTAHLIGSVIRCSCAVAFGLGRWD